MWGPSWGNFLMFLGCLFQDRFLIVLRSVLESIWTPFWQYNRTQNEEKTKLILTALSVSSFAHLNVIFEVVFGSWKQYGGTVGSFFWRRRRLGAPKALQAAPAPK